jgi:hypothetical protein
MKTSIIITNRFVEATEPSNEDHYGCDVNSQECAIGDSKPHIRLAAIARGEKMKSGVKVFEPTLDEINALIDECRWCVYFTSRDHLDDPYDVKCARPIHYSHKRFLEKLLAFKGQMEETKLPAIQ